jgi:hypothetical protein
LILIYGTGVWQMSVTWTKTPRFLTTYLVGALIFALTGEAIRWAHSRHLRAGIASPNESAASESPVSENQVIGTTILPVSPAPPVPEVHESAKKSDTTKPAISIATEKRLASADEELPWGLEVTLVANEDVSPLAVELEFTGEVGKFMATKPLGAFEQEQGGIVVERPDTILMERKSPAFTPQQPIIVWVYSKTQIKTKKLRSIPFSFPYPPGYLK